ncbi:hypothetical protein B0I35DRAFT_46495 [Stachybotrys elegans]|uniref:Uncharacterized protein n=1 Tax=Stachybotrys elegans TaxID=80388 RepID=A0A8K0T453_9HYPO|nr:hypothetical protein B0I35DRAFT_46495 [Stachybotrys elegans]
MRALTTKGVLPFAPTLQSLSAAFQTVSLENGPVILQLMSLLLETAKSAEIRQSEALPRQTILAFPTDDIAGLALLLKHKAYVDYGGGLAVKHAASSGSLKILGLLLDFHPTSNTILDVCIVVASSKLRSHIQWRVFKLLIKANDGMPATNMSLLLQRAVSEHPKKTLLPQFLRSRKVEILFRTMETALQKASRDLFVVLSDDLPLVTIHQVFRKAMDFSIVSERRHWIYEVLLQRQITETDMSNALLHSLLDNPEDLSVQKLLLLHGANVNHKKCKAFSIALQAKSLNAVRLLGQYIDSDKTASRAFNHARHADLDIDSRIQVY